MTESDFTEIFELRQVPGSQKDRVLLKSLLIKLIFSVLLKTEQINKNISHSLWLCYIEHNNCYLRNVINTYILLITYLIFI